MEKGSSEAKWLESILKNKTFPLTIGVVLCLGLAIFSWFKIPVEVMPKENVPPFLFLQVSAKEPMSPEKLELAFTLPVEGALRTLGGLISFSTQTNSRGLTAALTYKPQTNLDLAEFNMMEALQDLETRGIVDLKQVHISRANPDAPAITKLSITVNGNVSNLYRLLTEELRIGLESIPEISKVEISGVEPVEYRYGISASRVHELGLDQGGISGLANYQTVRESMGELPLGTGESMTTISGRLILEDLEGLQKTPLGKSSPWNLTQVSSVQLFDKANEEISRKNGMRAVFVEIYSKEGSNLFDLDNNLTNYLSSLKKENGDLSKLNFEKVFNRTDDLHQAINDVLGSLYEAMLITLLIVFLFLRRIKMTVFISMAIPITLLTTIMIMFIKGASLNILTLSGLILGIGMMVDAAILVVGRIYELRGSSENFKEAASRGAAETFPALLMSTLTNMAIFLPVAFIEGGDSFTNTLKAFQLPIISSLGSSLFVSLIILPLMIVHFSSKKPMKKSEIKTSRRAIGFFRYIQRHQLIIFVIAFTSVWFAFKYVEDIQQTDLETPRDPYSNISVKFSAEIAPKQRKAIFENVEKGLLLWKSYLKFKFVVSDFNPDFPSGSFMIYPESSSDADVELKHLDEGVAKFISDYPTSPGVIISAGYFGGGGGGDGAHQAMDSFQFSGPKLARLLELMKELKEQFSAVQGVDFVNLDQDENGNRELVFIPNEQVLQSYDINLNKLSNEISGVMGAVSLSNLRVNGRPVGVRIAFTPNSGDWSLDSLKQMKIRIGKDKFVNLADLGQVIPTNSISSIRRKEGTATTRIYVYYKDSATLGMTRAQVRGIVSTFAFPSGYGIPKVDSAARVEDMQKKTTFILLLSVALIYLLLGGMFESIFVPLAIIVTVPVALIFGVAGLKLMGMDLDVMARLSLVILVGIGVNSSIILIELINSLRRQGFERREAIAVGCSQRLKAVIMTASIQIVSVVPVAMGKAKIMGIPYSSLGISIISGMLFSTVITLLVLPIIYERLDDVEQYFRRKWSAENQSTDSKIHLDHAA